MEKPKFGASTNLKINRQLLIQNCWMMRAGDPSKKKKKDENSDDASKQNQKSQLPSQKFEIKRIQEGKDQ